MINTELLNSKLFIIFGSIVLVTTIPYISAQEQNINPLTEQQIREKVIQMKEMAIQVEQIYDYLSPEEQEKANQNMQKLMQQLLMMYSPEQQEYIIQLLNLMVPPQFLDKMMPPGYN